MLFKIFLLEKH